MKRQALLASAVLVPAFVAALGGHAFHQAHAAGVPALQPVAQSDECTSLGRDGRFGANVSLHAEMTSTQQAGQTLTFCEVKGEIAAEPGSHIGIVFRLPPNWNGRVFGLGGGGFAGNVTLDAAAPALARGYATLQTDGGHPSTQPWDVTWVHKPDGSLNMPALVDLTTRSVHEMVLLGKQVAATYYGHAPQRAYFQGCSSGGRQALIEAQRYPQDFDGLIAGAPAAIEPAPASNTFITHAFLAPEAKLSPAQIILINKAVLNACDALDGTKDGIVENPQACHWDPAPLLCRSGQSGDSCLSNAQVVAVRGAYAQHQDDLGRTIGFGAPRGSELSSFTFYMSIKGDYLDYTGYKNIAQAAGVAPNEDLAKAALDVTDRRASLWGRLNLADDPNLAPYFRRGGKLLMWQGSYDHMIAVPGTINYYNSVRRVTGSELGEDQVDKSLRLFLAVGVAHCRGGVGPSSFDGLTAIENWVEKGVVPTRMVATQPAVEAHGTADQSNNVPGQPALSRPMCPWPQLPRYRGKGDMNNADNFFCRA